MLKYIICPWLCFASYIFILSTLEHSMLSIFIFANFLVCHLKFVWLYVKCSLLFAEYLKVIFAADCYLYFHSLRLCFTFESIPFIFTFLYAKFIFVWITVFMIILVSTNLIFASLRTICFYFPTLCFSVFLSFRYLVFLSICLVL